VNTQQQKEKFWMIASDNADYGSTDLKDLEAIKPHKKEKRPPTSSLIVVLLQGVMQVGGFTAIIPTAMFLCMMIAGAVFLFSYELNVASRAVVYGVGSVLFLVGAQFAKGFGLCGNQNFTAR